MGIKGVRVSKGSDSIDYLFCERTERPPRALELVYLWYERENFPGDMQRIGLECQTQKNTHKYP